MMYIAVLIRLWCFKTMGRMFTYEVTIRPNHQLITGGPYAYVRHPSYTAVLLMDVGTAIVTMSSHGYVDECRVMSTPGRWIIITLFSLFAYTIWSLFKRGPVEDAGLRKEFGETWDRYSRAVPCRFIPGLI
ncbi:hypothetical protein K439DRAFT_1395755 [Ramaria rubella]|nr:hypothetical protein K439DRAFT_1395755 [Ramaria rubella]